MTRMSNRPQAAPVLVRALGASTLLLAALVILLGRPDSAAAKGDKPGVSVRIEGVTLVVKGGPAADTIVLRISPKDNTKLSVDVPSNPSSSTEIKLEKFDSIEVFGGAGDDVISIDEQNGGFTAEKPTTLNGEDGNDTLVGGSGIETLVGGAGDDTIVAGGAGSESSGGDGDDVVITGAGAGTVDAGSGDNVVMAAVVSSSSNGTVTVLGDNLDNTITISRNAAGQILTNGVAIPGATVASVLQIRVFGMGGNDTIVLNEANGPLPVANLYGGSGNDSLTGGSGADLIFGQSGNDTLVGRGGLDLLFGGSENDTMTGGDGDDQAFGESGDDRTVWNPGDDTDLAEGGIGTDTVEVNGGNGSEEFVTTANGTRVRFDRINPAPFFLDIGTNENLVLNANGGDDSHQATGNLAALISLTLDGGSGSDTLGGSNGADRIFGGDGNDFVDGQQGNDTVFMGAGDDTFNWDPGDGLDVVEGQAGSDKMIFNGANISEIIDISANGGRVRFARNIASIVLDLDDVEAIDVKVLGGADIVTVGDLSGTDLAAINVNLAAANGLGDLEADHVVVNATNGDDVVSVSGDASGAVVVGVTARVTVTGAESTNDRLTISALAGDDVIDASFLGLGAVQLTGDGGDGSDVLQGGFGDDTLLGGAGDDVLIGNGGLDILDGGTGDNIVIQ